MVRGDENETFLSCGYDDDKSNILYSIFKQMLLNIFQGTFFKKHHPMLLDEWSLQEYSTLFFYLPSTTDWKKKISQLVKNLSLHPIDCRYEDFKNYSRNQTDFTPQDLESPDLNKRLAAREIVVNFFKDAAQLSNLNLLRNAANTLLLTGGAKINAGGVINWIGKSQTLDQDRFRSTY